MFLVVLFVSFVLFLALVESFLVQTEKWGLATATLISMVVLAQVFHVANIFGFVHDHFLDSLKYLGTYVGVGIFWSFVKWFFFLRLFRSERLAAKSRYLKGQNLPADAFLTEDQLDDLKNFLVRQHPSNRLYPNTLDSVPEATNNKGRIAAWFVFWVFSMLGTILSDFAAKLANISFDLLRSTYQWVANKVVGDLQDLK